MEDGFGSEKRARGRPRGWDDKSEQNTIKSLDRAVTVLDHLSSHSGRTLSELAQDLGESAATVYRVLVTFEQRGLVEFDPARQLWHIGPGAFVIGARYLRRTSLVERARPILRRLMEQSGETANLGIMRGGSVLFISQVETHAHIRAFFPPGTMAPPHSSGIGKALLAYMHAGQVSDLMRSQELARFTDKTLTTPDLLLSDLEEARARGYAIDNEEKTIGMRCVAAPVFDMHGEAIAGLSISGPSQRVELSKVDGYANMVLSSAKELTLAMGGSATAGSA